MNYKEILGRLTGISVPVFGVSWNPPKPEVAIARKVIAYLEDRRLLYNPFHLEVLDFCVDSALDIRKFLTDQIGELDTNSKLAEHLRAIRLACRHFLNQCGTRNGRPIRYHFGGPREAEFFMALGELRAVIGVHIAAIAVMHGLPIEGDLATILPSAADEDSV
jgi:hypothetical protein